jgi:FkbM family methyltransferase
MALQRWLKRFLIQRLRARGHVLIPEWHLPDVPLEEHLRALIARYDFDVVLDVGANFGQFHDTLRNEVDFAGPIVSFEPVSGFREQLESRQHTDRGWDVEPYALGSVHQESAVIHVMESPGLSSIKDRDIGAMQSLLPAPDRVGVEGDETIEVRRLDDVAPSHPVLAQAKRALLKTDTQGFDLEVLRGSRAFLAQTIAIVIELSVLPLYADAPTYEDVIAELHALGFDLSGMFPVMLDPHLRVIEFDGIFVRRPAAASARRSAAAGSASARTSVA